MFSSMSEDFPSTSSKKSRNNESLSGECVNSPSDKTASGILRMESATNKRSETDLVSPENWIDIFTPTKIDELAVHPKKIEELQEWFKHCNALRAKNPAQICMLTGPTGAGKTEAVRLVAKTNVYDVQEWINPIDQETFTKLGDQMNSYVSSQVGAFKNFLLRASRYKSLLSDCQKRLLLVEDFPNALINDSSSFASILDDFVSYGKSPIIFIIADSKGKQLNISYNLFPDDVKHKYNIKHISFNPIATTLMNKAMKRFCALMAQERRANFYKAPQATVIDSIAYSSQGDIRNALINLHFASLKDAPSLQTKLIDTAPKSRGKKQQALKTIGRDESVTMLHVLGRVFNPKYNNENRFVHSPNSLVEQHSMEPKRMINFIYSNYLMHFPEIESIIIASDGISIADVVINDYREESLAPTALNIAISSVMVANSQPVSGWKPVRGPKRLTIETPPKEVLHRYGLRQNMSGNLFALEYRTYIKHIPSSSH